MKKKQYSFLKLSSLKFLIHEKIYYGKFDWKIK